MTQVIAPRVYVGTYAKYTAGSLKGAWMDLTDFSSYDEFLQAAKELHSDEEDPELMFQDFEGFPRRYYHESSLDAELWDYLGIVGDDEDRAEAVSDFIENGCELSDFEEAYQGQFKDEEEFAEQLVDDLGYLNEMPENLRYYFDYEKFARDLFLTDYWMSSNGHVFRNM